LFVLAWFVLATGAESQMRSGGPYFGIAGGASSSEIRGDIVNTDFRWGGMAGAFVGTRPNRNSVTTLGINWVQKGGEGTSLDYIEIPLTVGATAPLGDGSFAATLYTGIGFGFQISCSSEAALGDEPSADALCSNVHDTEWTWPFGIRLSRFGSSGRPVGIEVRYAWGLTNITPAVFATNRAWQLRLFFGVGGR
jgi:hypothetical protein